jgi:transcriptional regulator with XRE-family HTH domain
MNPELKYRLKTIVLERTETRAQRGELVAELASKAGLSPNHVRKIWNYALDAESEARLEDLVAFSEVLGIPPVELLHPTLRTKIIDFAH